MTRPVAAAVLVALLAGCAEDSPSEPEPRVSQCLDLDYPDAATSAYILPWRTGESYRVGQGNCVLPGTGSHSLGSRAEFAYDIAMPIGTDLLAVRAGTVIYVEESFEDGTDVPGEENTVLVQHEDGSVSNFGHLTHLGAVVTEGQDVAQGELLGRSGDSGASTEPHLHFEVLECEGDPLVFDPVVSFNPTCHSVPVTFSNTRAHPDGLIEGEIYTAEP